MLNESVLNRILTGVLFVSRRRCARLISDQKELWLVFRQSANKHFIAVPRATHKVHPRVLTCRQCVEVPHVAMELRQRHIGIEAVMFL